MSNQQKVKPTTREEAIKWNKYCGYRWDWIPIYKWPWNIAKAAMKKHKNRFERFAMFCFFVGNGMDPNLAIQAIVQDDPIDAAGYEDLLQMKARCEDPRNKITYWDVVLNKSMPIEILPVDLDNGVNYMPKKRTFAAIRQENIERAEKAARKAHMIKYPRIERGFGGVLRRYRNLHIDDEWGGKTIKIYEDNDNGDEYYKRPYKSIQQRMMEMESDDDLLSDEEW